MVHIVFIKLYWSGSSYSDYLCQSNFCYDFNITDEILSGMKYLFSLYLPNSFILNSFLTFLLPLAFIYALIKFKLVLRHLRGTIRELYMSGKTFLPWHTEEPNVAKQLVCRIFTRWFGTYCICICSTLLDLMQVPRSSW